MSSLATNIAAANKAFSDAANKIEHLLGQAWQLDAGDPEHLTIAMEMGRALTQAMMSHGGSVTVLSPLILLAAAELQQHMNASRTGLTGMPELPAEPFSFSFSTTPGPISAQEAACGGGARGIDDELEEEEPASLVITTNKRARRAYVKVDTEDEMEDDGDEEDAVELPRKIAATHVAKPMTSGLDLMKDEFTNSTAEGYHKDHGGKLRICALCSRLKIRCEGKGSKAPKMKTKSVMAWRTRSQSRCCRSPPPAAGAFADAPAASQEQLPLLQFEIRAEPAPPSIPNQEMQDLRDEVASLWATVEALQQQVVNGDWQFQEMLAAQDQCADLLAAELQPTAGTDPVDVLPGAQSPLVQTAQPTPDTPASDSQPGAEPLLVPTEDTSIPLGTTPAGTSTEANFELAASPATPQAEVACLPVVIQIYIS
ncbi:uncharacterized protein F5147DRAFT_839939 [Suillus discolor]|uniref:Uncharacterized protein n=1 Tax=Suillus discolor TaxID=1912936 RepID=A0A9P7EXQ0_9AGAM|nr:uncharacterized protein F5147DRAFT_839939 [Suillus discolor]KAG2096759.1 hypothetical protein F5147DRAFT_839939 [Suillus discolor]